MKEVKIIHNHVLKELDDIKELYDIEIMMNKALELVINKLVND